MWALQMELNSARKSGQANRKLRLRASSRQKLRLNIYLFYTASSVFQRVRACVCLCGVARSPYGRRKVPQKVKQRSPPPPTPGQNQKDLQLGSTTNRKSSVSSHVQRDPKTTITPHFSEYLPFSLSHKIIADPILREGKLIPEDRFGFCTNPADNPARNRFQSRPIK